MSDTIAPPPVSTVRPGSWRNVVVRGHRPILHQCGSVTYWHPTRLRSVSYAQWVAVSVLRAMPETDARAIVAHLYAAVTAGMRPAGVTGASRL